jgi:hypothetical protein
MSKHSVKRLVVLCTAAYSDPLDKFNPITYGIANFVRLFAHTAFADFRAVGEVVKANGDRNKLEWTVVRVPVLTNDSGDVFVAGYVGDGKTGNLLSRKAFARFVSEEMGGRAWVGKAPFISSTFVSRLLYYKPQNQVDIITLSFVNNNLCLVFGLTARCLFLTETL